MDEIRPAWSQSYGTKSWQGIVQRRVGNEDRWEMAFPWMCPHRHGSREAAAACAQKKIDRTRRSRERALGLRPL